MIVTVLALLGLALATVWLLREPTPVARASAILGAVSGFALALGAALLAGRSTGEAVAVGLMGAAVLSLVLLGQVRMLRGFIRRQ